MRTARTLIALLVFGLELPAHAATVRLRTSDHGVWGAELRACQGKIGRTECARILPLVLDDNGIRSQDLRRLPKGKEIVVKDEYLHTDFRPSAEAVERARAIFSGVTSDPQTNPNMLEKALEPLRRAKAELEENLRSKNRELEEVRGMAAAAQKTISELDDKLKHLEAPEVSGFDWISFAKYALVGLLGFIAGLLVWRMGFEAFKLQNRILPLVAKVKDPSGKKRKFRLEEDNTYTCLLCEEQTRGRDGRTGRERGRGLKLKNLEKHLLDPEIHPELFVVVDEPMEERRSA